MDSAYREAPALRHPRDHRPTIRYGATSLRPKQAPLGTWLALWGGGLIALAGSLPLTSAVDSRLHLVGALVLLVGLLSWSRRRAFAVAWTALAAGALFLWGQALVDLTAFAAAGPGFWLLLAGGLLTFLASWARLPWSAPTRTAAHPLEPFAPLSMRR